ncbi:unnamed protein product [Sphagnum balticum]
MYAFTLGSNTVYSITKAGVEWHCSYRRPGTITYTRQQMYVCQLFGNFTNAAVVTRNGSAATVSFDQMYLNGSAISEVEILQQGANVCVIKLPLTYSSLVNDVYVNWTIGGYNSLRPIQTYYRANQTTYNTIVVEEFNDTFGNSSYFNYLDVTFTTQASNCQVTNMFYVLLFSIYAFLVLIMVVIAFLTLFEYKRSIFLRGVKSALWWVSADWSSKIDFCNEITGEPTYYQDGDRYISMEKEGSVTGTDSVFLSGSVLIPLTSKASMSAFGKMMKCIICTRTKVSVQCIVWTRTKVYPLKEPQKNDLRCYLREIMGDPKMVCVNENLTHHYKIVDVIKKLSASPDGKEGIRLCI